LGWSHILNFLSILFQTKLDGRHTEHFDAAQHKLRRGAQNSELGYFLIPRTSSMLSMTLGMTRSGPNIQLNRIVPI